MYKLASIALLLQDSGLPGATSSEFSLQTKATKSNNEDLPFEKLETKNDVSQKKSEDRPSVIPPRQLRDKSARRPLVLDIPGLNKAKSAVPSLVSPTLSPDPTKRRTQSRYNNAITCKNNL